MNANLPKTNAPGGDYVSVIVHGGVAYVSGQLPRRGDELMFKGRVGAEIDLAAAQRAAAVCAELCLAALAEAVGGLDRVEQVLRITGYVASAPGFVQQSQVMNGASDVFVEHLGSRGRHARTSVGVAELPRGAPVEIDLIAAVRAGV